MKFGEQLEQASVPSWSLHNVDYNSLKHQIKTHTTKDQATTAIAIPGQQDHSLQRFENAFYNQLCSQHDRVGLFVTSKADEVSRRLRHLSSLVNQLMLKCADTRGLCNKRQQRFLKYHSKIEDCGQDIEALSRFVDAQVTAFRKILKKYRKWTGSTTLGSRFRDNVLGAPKSFTNYNFTPLQQQYRELCTRLEAASPFDNTTLYEPQSSPPILSQNNSTVNSHRSGRSSHSTAAASTFRSLPQPTFSYWNEYEHGSEAGDHREDDDTYVIYIDPNVNGEFPAYAYIKNMFGAPVGNMRHWLKSQKKAKDTASTQATAVTTPTETQSLLGGRHHSRTNTGSSTAAASSSTPTDYFSIRTHHSYPPLLNTVSDNNGNNNAIPTEEDGYIYSEDELRRGGYGHRHGYHADFSPYPAVEYDMELYKDRLLTRGVVLAFVTSFVLFGISSLLLATGRHRMRLEVDAGATVGSSASLFCACMGLAAMLYRQYPNGYLYSLAVWMAFLTACALNGMLLILVVSSSGV